MIGSAVAIVLASVIAGAAWLVSSLPKTSGHVVVAGISQPVEIIRDRRGVPHIYAADEADAFHALGFVHAQDRLFQMDFTRLAAQGRLSEVIGPALVDSDRFIRMLDLVGQAEATLQSLEPQWRRLLDAYAAGVNAFLDGHRGAWPPEYLAAPSHARALAGPRFPALGKADDPPALGKLARRAGARAPRHQASAGDARATLAGLADRQGDDARP